jgi:acetylornithine deacetylase
MARVIPAIEAFFRDELVRTSDVNFGPSTGSIGVIKGGSGVNIVPEECRIEIDIRLLPGQDWKAAYEGVASSVAGAVDGLDGVSAEVEEPFLVDAAFELSPAHELVSSALRAVRGDASEVVFFSCDGSKIAAKGGPCIVLGPGDIAQAHTADEFIELVELEKAVEVYSRLARSLMPV